MKISKCEKAILALYAFSVFISSSFYMCWSTYEIRILSYAVRFLSYAAVLPLAWLVVKKCTIKIKRFLLFAMILAVALEFLSNYFGALYSSRPQIRLLINFFILFALPDGYRKKIFEYMIKIFAVMVLPSLIYYLLSLAGINLPYRILYGVNEAKTLSGVYYKHYFGGLVISGSPGRYCGVFDEPGVVGTYAALLFAGAGNKKDKFTWLVLVEGLLSFSMACYAILFVYILIKAFTKGIVPFAAVCAVLLIGFMIFMNINFEGTIFSLIQNRIDTSSLIWVKDNRTTNDFEQFYRYFKEAGGYPLLFGDGRTILDNLPMSVGSSYKMLLVRYGVIGVVLLAGVFAAFIFEYGISKTNLPFIIAFTASVYQRPYIFTIFYVCLFLCALSFMSDRRTERELMKKGKRIRLAVNTRGQLCVKMFKVN